MTALGLVVSDKKIFESCILKTYLLTPWPTYATNRNRLNNFDRGTPRDYSCEVWSKSNDRIQRRSCLKKLLTHWRVDRRWATDNGPLQKLTLRTLSSGELKMKALGLLVLDKQIFENCNLKTYVWPRDLLKKPTGMVWTTLVGDHPGIIPVKFGQNPMSCFRGEVV